MRDGGRFACEYRILDRDGRVVWWRDEGRVLPDPDGKARFVRGFVLDITEQRMAEESLRRLRLYDQLTGLPNRMMLLNRLGRALVESARTTRPLALLILALDRFKDINNTLGHHNGDLIVRELAARLGDVLGDGDRVARLRGDEFAVLLPDADGDLRAPGRRAHPGRAREAVHGAAAADRGVGEHGDRGGAGARDRGRGAAAARRRGRAGGAKLAGGRASLLARARAHDPARLALLGELRRALAADELRLHYQPKVDLKTRTMVGAEALLRWPHPKRGIVPPGEFMPLAEQTGLIRPLTRWVLERRPAFARLGAPGGSWRSR